MQFGTFGTFIFRTHCKSTVIVQGQKNFGKKDLNCVYTTRNFTIDGQTRFSCLSRSDVRIES